MMMKRFASRGVAPVIAAAGARFLHFPISRPPIPVTYLDSDPLEFAMRNEARIHGFDDFTYMRELAFIRINDNPTVGEFRALSKEQRADMFWGSDRQDFFRWLTLKTTGTAEHLYHEGW